MYWNTVEGLLKDTLMRLMNAPEFDAFRLVGGTALSLQIGHRMSVDIDLFTDAKYGTVNFKIIDNFLQQNFKYTDGANNISPAIGKSYIIGEDSNNAVKLDVYYTDDFIQPALINSGVRMATIEEIIAMKIDIVAREGRKKDFWDLHGLLDKYTIMQMLQLHQQRYLYNHDQKHILKKLTDFTFADNDFEPICLKGKYWELIKLDILETLENIN